MSVQIAALPVEIAPIAEASAAPPNVLQSVEEVVAFVSGELPEVILARIKEHVPGWIQVQISDISVTKLSGLSNACYKVALRTDFPL